MSLEKEPKWLTDKRMAGRLNEDDADHVADNFHAVMGESMSEVSEQPTFRAFFLRLLDRFEKLNNMFPQLEKKSKEYEEALQDRDTTIEQLQNQLSKLNVINESKQQAEAQLQAAEDENTDLKARLRELQESQQNVDETELNSLHEEIEERDNEIQSLKKQITELQTKGKHIYQFKIAPHIRMAAELVLGKEQNRSGKEITMQDVILHTFWNQVQYGAGDHFPPVSDRDVKMIVKKAKQEANAGSDS